jgi:hypothetical protein
MRKGRFGVRTVLWAFVVVVGCEQAWTASAMGATELKIVAAPSVALYGEPFS